MAYGSSNVNKAIWFKVGGDGYFYKSSSEPREGYVEVDLGKFGKSYRLIADWIEGNLVQVSLGTAQFDTGQVTVFRLLLDDKGEKVGFSAPLVGASGRLNKYIASFIKFLPNIVFGEKLRLTPLRKKANEQFADGAFIISNTKQYLKHAFKNGDGKLPDVEKSKALDGKDVYDSSKRDKFLVEYLRQWILDNGSDKAYEEQSVQETEGSLAVKPAKGEQAYTPEPETIATAVPDEDNGPDLPF